MGIAVLGLGLGLGLGLELVWFLFFVFLFYLFIIFCVFLDEFLIFFFPWEGGRGEGKKHFFKNGMDLLPILWFYYTVRFFFFCPWSILPLSLSLSPSPTCEWNLLQKKIQWTDNNVVTPPPLFLLFVDPENTPLWKYTYAMGGFNLCNWRFLFYSLLLFLPLINFCHSLSLSPSPTWRMEFYFKKKKNNEQIINVITPSSSSFRGGREFCFVCVCLFYFAFFFLILFSFIPSVTVTEILWMRFQWGVSTLYNTFFFFFVSVRLKKKKTKQKKPFSSLRVGMWWAYPQANHTLLV